MSVKSDPLAYPPRGLNREEAAHHVGATPELFVQMVNDGRMPVPKRIDDLLLWDRFQLDTAYVALVDDQQ